jgi:hypothetical protein
MMVIDHVWSHKPQHVTVHNEIILFFRSSQKAKSTGYACKPSNTTNFPSLESPAQMVEAPVFHPTEKEFQDPLEYIDRIRPVAEKFGLCRVVPPPNFKVSVKQLVEFCIPS